jgi:hypothetical protein
LKLNDELKNGTSESQSKAKKEIEKLKISVDNLRTEMNNLQKHCESVVKFLETKKTVLLDEISSPNKRDISKYVIQVYFSSNKVLSIP